MSVRSGRNFTTLQNLQLVGSEAGDSGVGMLELKQGLTNTASTVSVQMYGGGATGVVAVSRQDPYFHISNAGLSIGTGFIQIIQGDAKGTLRLSAAVEDDRAYTLPAKSGRIALIGSFLIAHAAISANSYESTIVTVTGIRTDDTVGVSVSKAGVGSAFISARGFAIPIDVVSATNRLEILFWNPTGTATTAHSSTYVYTVTRD